jgi:hypothetical protein
MGLAKSDVNNPKEKNSSIGFGTNAMGHKFIYFPISQIISFGPRGFRRFPIPIPGMPLIWCHFEGGNILEILLRSFAIMGMASKKISPPLSFIHLNKKKQ